MKNLVVPRFATEAEEAKWRDEHMGVVGENLIAGLKDGTAHRGGPRRVLQERRGRTSSEQALALLRSPFRDAAPEILRGAILALSECQNTAPLPGLLAVARSNPNQALQVLALRGYLKLVGLPSQRPNPESARLLSDAMGLARQPAEKIALLALLPNYPCAESRQIAQSMLKDEAVSKEAQAAIDRLNGAPGGSGGRGVRGAPGGRGPQGPTEGPPQG